MNTDLQHLQPYPFEKLAALKAGIVPPAIPHIALSIGEPKHPAPDFIRAALIQNLQHLATYPSTKGILELRRAIADWAMRRFNLDRLDIEREVLPVNGTREALFAFAQAAIERTPQGSPKPLVVCPNPFYQIYEGAAYLAGAEPHFIDCTAANDFIPDFDAVPAAVWQRCQLLFLCSPGNPTGAVLDAATLKKIINLADRYDFVIASDECYSEIYSDEQQPPLGLLEVCQQIGRNDYRRCVVFHSLSKRSNVPGLRSGFVAGDAEILQQFLLYRTYHGCAMPVQHQWASIAAWSDEQHVRDNRASYRKKFDAVIDILGASLDIQRPPAAFYLWAGTPIDDIEFARRLFAQQNVTVLPGQYLARATQDGNPGANRIRMALVADFDECIAAAKRIKQFVASL
ncbi:MAG TPA: succinyldiaminopimelate transaminase [Spongiibacteraceae bacterium]|nr:succinyldiaminopimelate transaminase [Spongiibacteraceae bacterium]